MSETEPIEAPHPRETTVWFGHAEAERTLLEAFRSDRVPHAWLIGGEPGVGKATLAYRMARFVLANPDPRAPAVQAARAAVVHVEGVAGLEQAGIGWAGAEHARETSGCDKTRNSKQRPFDDGKHVRISPVSRMITAI